MKKTLTMQQPAFWVRLLYLLVLLCPVLGWSQGVAPTPLSLTAGGTAYTQNFDGLANSATSSTVPAGFGFTEPGTNALYTAGTGSSGTGDTYSFGGTGATDRAFGTLLSGSGVFAVGAAFTNNTGSTISSLTITYTGEQWRYGPTTARTVPDRLDFQYSTDATSLSAGTYTDVNALDFTAPVTTGTVGQLDGNASANRTAGITATITGLALADGATIYLRWLDFNASSSDDGLAVDDFSLTPTLSTSRLAVTQGGTAYANGGTAYDFGSQTNFTTSSPTLFILSNTGTSPLPLSAITTTGDFRISSGARPRTVAAGDTAMVRVVFEPTATGTRTGTLVIRSNAANAATYTVNLTGNSTASMVMATLAVTQGSTGYTDEGAPYIFAGQTINTSSSPVAFTLTNSGPDPLTINSIVASGNFAISGTTPTTVAGNGGTATVSVTFTPTATGPRTGTLVITSNSTTGAEYTVNLQGEGLAPAPTLTAMSPNAVYGGATYSVTLTGTDFGTVANTTVNFNGASLVPSFVSATSITVALPVPTASATYPVTVTTPSGTTGAQTLTVTAPPAGFFEPFEAGSKPGYTTGTVTLATGDYLFTDALLGTTAADRKNNTRSARIQAGSVTMATSKANGAGTITVQAANYDTDTNGRLVVSVSTDGGATFTAYTSAATVLTGTLATYTFTANVPGNIRVRFSNSGSQRLNIDDLQITDYTGPALTPQIAVSQGATPVANGGTFSGFASTMVSTTSPAVTFTITNSDAVTPLTISGFTASGTEFVTSGTTPTSVAAGGTATFNVVFRPTGTGTRTGSITINNNSPANAAYVLNFSGTGIPFVAQPFTPGNLVVSRVGTGSAALAGTATPVFLDEYSASTASQPSSVQSIALPTTDQSGNQTLTLPGTGTTTGFLSRSIDGQYLTLAGYDAAAGSTLPGSSATLNRTVARVGISAGVGVTTALTDAFSGGEVRSATTTAGTNLWLGGSVQGIRHTTAGATTSTLVASAITNTRVTKVFDTNVYFSTASGTTNRGIWKITPDFANTTGATAIQIVATGNSSDPYDFAMLDNNSFVEGVDVLYVIDGGGQLLKYSKNTTAGDAWTARGSQTIASGARGLTAQLSGGVVRLYYNTATALYALTDATASDVSISGTPTATLLATAAPNTAFRGVAFAPELLDLVGGLDRENLIVDGGAYRDIFVEGRRITSVGPLSASGTVTISGTNSTLNTGCSPLTGPASFVMQTDVAGDGGTLVICSPDGLSTSGPTGQIQVTGTRDYGTNGHFQFVSPTNAAQVTGPGFPASVNSIYTGSAGGVTLSKPVAVNEALFLYFSNLNLSGQTLTLRSTNSGFPAGAGRQARVVQLGSFGVVGTTAVVQRAITNPTPLAYRHYSSPVSGETLGTLATSGFTPVFNTAYNNSATPNLVTPFPNVFGYDESRLRPAGSGGSPATNYTAFDKGWFSPTAATPWEAGRGYTVNISRSAVVDFAGQLNNGTIERPGLTRTVNNGGWHLLGNPYPENIRIDALTRSSNPNDPTANLAGMDGAIYVYEASSQYGGAYRAAVNGVGGDEIALGQGFFARTSVVGTAGTVRFTNAVRGGGNNQFRQRAETRPLLRLNVADAAGPLADNAVVYFEQGATNSFDAAADAVKLANPSGLTLGTVLPNGEALSIDGRPVLGSQTQLIPLNLAVPRAGTYTFSVGSLLHLNGTAVVLRDALTGTRTALTANAVYSFRTTGTTANGRFVLEFQPAAAPLATAAQALAAQVQVYPNPASGSFQLTLPLAAKGGVATLTNALGQTVLTRALTGPETTFDVQSLAAGVYQLHLSVEGTKMVRRVVVK